MSTALVSAFYDVGEVLYQNRRNNPAMYHERTKLPVGASLTRNQLGCRTMGDTSQFSLSPDRLSPPANVNSMISPSAFNDNMLLSDFMANAACHNHKLDRSISEPVSERKLSLGGQNAVNNNSSNQNINSSRYKTELCRPFEESGHCKYGDKCQFAHGLAELRTLARHPKYKTELCRTFHTIGFCPYGPRCHFIHNEDERRLSQIIQLKKQQDLANMHRPKALNFTPAGMRDNLGSTADSPPSSITDSPTMSPTFLSDDIFSTSSFAPIPPASAPPTIRNAFTFGDYMPPASSHPMMTPLNVATVDPIMNLTASLQATSLGQRDHDFRDCLQGGSPSAHDALFSGYPQPSPPESLSEDSGVSTCGSPLDVSRGLHLSGIFSRVSDDC